MIILALFCLIFIILLIYYIFSKKEKWCNTYSGWPGPLESPCRSNIPALYGNPKYMSDCHFEPNPHSTTGYYSMKQLPN